MGETLPNPFLARPLEWFASVSNTSVENVKAAFDGEVKVTERVTGFFNEEEGLVALFIHERNRSRDDTRALDAMNRGKW